MAWTSESISSLRLLLRHYREDNVELGISLASGDDALPEGLLLELMIVALNWPKKRTEIHDVLAANGVHFPLHHLQAIQLTRAGWDYWSPLDKLLWEIDEQNENLALRLAQYAEQNWGYAWLFLCHKLPKEEAHLLVDKRIENNQLSLQEVSDLPYPPVLLKHENIERLRLENCGFSHFPELCQMPNLRTLSLSNDRNQTLPSSILDCENLEELNIYASQLKCLPNGIAKLKSLKRLDLSYCSQLGNLPPQVGKLKQLRALIWRLRADLDNRLNQKMLQKIPDALLELKNLKHLKLPHHNISRLHPGFGRLKSLEYLDLRRNGFDHFPKALLGLDSLTVLQITLAGPYASLKKGNQLSIELPKDWQQAKNIEQLDLSDSWLKGDFESLQQLSHLRHLRLYGVKMNGESPHLPALRQLLPHCKIEL